MYGWNDPRNPDGSRRQPEPAADEPAWPTDRPEPRSAYLFGDEPDSPSGGGEQPTDRWEQPANRWEQPANRWEQPANEWDRPTGQWDQQQPTAPWRPDAEPVRGWGAAEHPHYGRTGDPYHEQPTPGWDATPNWQHGEPTQSWQQDQPGDWRDQRFAGGQDNPSGGWHGAATPTGQPAPAGQWPAPKPTGWYADEPTTSMPPIAGAAAPTDGLPAGEDRPGRRNRRPLLIGGAAAAAMLVVSLGVGAVTFAGGDATSPTSAIDDIVATNPTEESALPSATPTSASPSPSATPSTSAPAPSPSVTPSRKPSPTASRSTATSRPAPTRTTAPPTSSTTTPTNGNVSEDAAEVVRLANVERAAAGCAALSIDDKLMTAAQRHSQDQADNKKMTHTGSNGSGLGDRVNDVSYQWSAIGENVAWNQQSPAAVMKAWMNSPGHKANILNCSFTEIGVGIATSNGPYWTQVFAAPR